MTNVEVIHFESRELVLCDQLLLADKLLRDYCDFILNNNLDNDEPLTKPDLDQDGTYGGSKGPKPLSTTKQLVLARSCLSDVLYSILCLGLWCAEKTVKLYLIEFSRLLHNDLPAGNFIAATSTVLNNLYGRLHETSNNFRNDAETQDKFLIKSSTTQLKTLLHYIRDYKPPSNTAWPICIIHVRRKVIAKVLALWLNEIASTSEEYSYVKPNYIVGSYRKHRNRMAVDDFDLHHETSIRDFRFGNCNVLVVSSSNERCATMLRCNLVVSFDYPKKFSDYTSAKINCRNDSSKYVIFSNDLFEDNQVHRITDYINAEKLFNNTSKKESLELAESDLMRTLESKYPPYPDKNTKSPANIWRGISVINKYCSKLPSDSFTKLAPDWCVNEYISSVKDNPEFYCEVRMPINSPVRQTIVGPVAPTKNIAMRLAAFAACKVLNKEGELDDNMLPIKRESMKNSASLIKGHSKDSARTRSSKGKNQSIGSTKHRQYYKKRIAQVFSGPPVKEGVDCYLYKFTMVLTCPIPEEQNRRGRRIIDPSETNRNYAIICKNRLPRICSFPVFTRSGEVMISVDIVTNNIKLNETQVRDLRTFHEYTFSKVLRLEKYPTTFDTELSPFTVLLAPVIDITANDTQIDWQFVDKIVESNRDSYTSNEDERRNFKFNHDAYIDAVVIPWYRLTDRQQFAYYVAEICANMSPKSPFPDESSGFETFIDYYKSKYDINIYNLDQPVLDVDHTSARLNLLTPRYVNRKGRTLPSSTAKTRRESRESLVQKQLLIPELCTIHPFPASFWRKAVCLPCIFYRLNSLFLAEELRREVASAIKVGFIELPVGFEWPQLDFGWSLKDVINVQSVDESNDSSEEKQESASDKMNKIGDKKSTKIKLTKTPKVSQIDEASQSAPEKSGEPEFVIDHFDPSKYDIPYDIPLDAPPEDWASIKLISTKSSDRCATNSGWDQPIEQRDLFLQHTNEISWDDCEMEFDGEMTERPGEVRCGSPSSFEPGVSMAPGVQFFSCNRSNTATTTGGKSVQFEDQSGDDDDDDDDYESKSGESNGIQFDIIQKPAFDSDSSWSLSDDEDINEVDDDDTTGTNSCYVSNWKQEEKTSNQPMPRELFLPYVKVENDELESSFKDYEKLKSLDSASITDGTKSMSSLSSSSSDASDKLRTTILKHQSGQPLIDMLVDLFEQDIHFTDEQIAANLKSWCNYLVDLDSRILATLIEDPELLRDNGIELITVDDSLRDYNLEMQPTFGELLPDRDSDRNWPSEEWKNIKFDPTRKEIKSNGPGPSVILQALTMSNASDGINLERLETVGDSFLKYSITAYLYCMYPTMHEGKLSYLRSTEISNANLYHLGRTKNLGELMSATKFEPNDNWLPPGYSVADGDNATIGHTGDSVVGDGVPAGDNNTGRCKRRDNNSNKKREIDKALAEVPYDLLRQHSIPDKSIADCVEALIGAYLTASGSRAALLFMQWLGLKVIPPTFNLDDDLKLDSQNENEIWRWLCVPPSPLICTPPYYEQGSPEILHEPEELRQTALDTLNRLYLENNMNKFEQDIMYTFKDKAYLVQAFTHNSFHVNHVTDCHQRLEFLGDALLDYLITRYLFEDPHCHSPGTLTDLRSALVNNTFFASLAVKYEFHKYLKFISDELFNVIDSFVKKFRFDSKSTITKGYTLLISEGESEYAEDIEVPKALGDVFESVAGAIYLDSGMSLDQVWEVYFKMMKPEIEYFSSHVPRSPIRELLESMPQNVRFSPSELAPDRKHRVTAEVFGLGRFTGVGRNKHSAKSTAAKRALRMLALKRRKQGEEQELAELVQKQAAIDYGADKSVGEQNSGASTSIIQ